MRPPPYLLWVFREGRWIEVMTTELVVGDVMSAVRTEQQRKGAKSMAGDQTEVELAVVPCDVIIVAGSCVVNEALLTGESVPQVVFRSFLLAFRQLDIFASFCADQRLSR